MNESADQSELDRLRKEVEQLREQLATALYMQAVGDELSPSWMNIQAAAS